MKKLKCSKCGEIGGKLTSKANGPLLCETCRRPPVVASATAIRGTYKPWFSWQLGRSVNTYAEEREIERNYATGGPGDYGFYEKHLGVSRAELQDAARTNKAETISRDLRFAAKCTSAARTFKGGSIR